MELTLPKEMSRNKTGESRVQSLDGVRFLAFLGVFLAHVYGNIQIFQLGTYGVRVFFVLSGFLIGGILLKQRESGHSFLESLRIFYIRRFFRIFPLYYGVLFLVWILPRLHCNVFGVTGGIGWQIFYLTNMYRYFHGYVGPTAHFWSLAVEEQFYLIAPIILLCARKSQIELGLILLWILNAAIHLLVAFFIHNPQVYLLSNIQFGYLGFGVAAAMIQQWGTFAGVSLKMLYRIGIACIPISIVLILLWMAGQMSDDLFQNVFEWPLGILTAAGVTALWRREWPTVDVILSFAPMVFLGQISYGLYVFHYLILIAMEHLPDGVQLSRPVYLLTTLGTTILVSIASWFLFEKPMNNLKRFFPYSIIAKPSAIRNEAPTVTS